MSSIPSSASLNIYDPSNCPPYKAGGEGLDVKECKSAEQPTQSSSSSSSSSFVWGNDTRDSSSGSLSPISTDDFSENSNELSLYGTSRDSDFYDNRESRTPSPIMPSRVSSYPSLSPLGSRSSSSSSLVSSSTSSGSFVSSSFSSSSLNISGLLSPTSGLLSPLGSPRSQLSHAQFMALVNRGIPSQSELKSLNDSIFMLLNSIEAENGSVSTQKTQRVWDSWETWIKFNNTVKSIGDLVHELKEGVASDLKSGFVSKLEKGVVSKLKKRMKIFQASFTSEILQPNWSKIYSETPNKSTKYSFKTEAEPSLHAYHNAFVGNLPFLILGGEDIREDIKLIENVGTIATYPQFNQETIRTLFEGIYKKLESNELKQAAEHHLKKGALINESNWSILRNDMIMLGAIHAGKMFILGAKPKEALLWDATEKRPRTLGRELLMLHCAGYVRVKNNSQLGINFMPSDQTKSEGLTLLKLRGQIAEFTKTKTALSTIETFLDITYAENTTAKGDSTVAVTAAAAAAAAASPVD